MALSKGQRHGEIDASELGLFIVSSHKLNYYSAN